MSRAWGFVALVLLLGACRGQVSAQAPRHLFEDMDWQPKYRPEAKSAWFADGRSMRSPVEGTVARGELDEDAGHATGRDEQGAFVSAMPGAITAERIRRGQERFEIYCTPCHDRAGSGHGVVVGRGFPPPIDLASQRGLALAEGQIFSTISTGVRNMPSYGMQIPVEDRWAIVAWVRVLQRARHATLDDVPPAERAKLEKEP